MIVALTCLLLSAPAADEKAKKELDALQGVWRLESVESNGKPFELTDPQPRWHIKGDKVQYGGEDLAGLTLDPQTTPRTIDLAFVKPKKVYEGVYSVEGDTLKVCVNRLADGVKERPQGFDTEGKEGLRLLVFKREKDGDPRAGVAGFVGVAIKASTDGKSVIVIDTVEGSPAMKAGVKKEDVILKVGTDEVTGLQETVNMIRKVKPGSELTLRVLRGEKEQDVKIKVGTMPFLYLD